MYSEKLMSTHVCLHTVVYSCSFLCCFFLFVLFLLVTLTNVFTVHESLSFIDVRWGLSRHGLRHIYLSIFALCTLEHKNDTLTLYVLSPTCSRALVSLIHFMTSCFVSSCFQLLEIEVFRC